MKSISSIVFLITLLLLSHYSCADTGYRYRKDLSFFDTIFMGNSLPIVNHPAVKNVCTGCHWTMLPGLLPSRSWEKIMLELDDHFGKKIELVQPLKITILQYLKENAAEFTESKISIKILDSIGDKIPIRLSESEYFEDQHKDVKASLWNHSKVVFKGNCVACHIDLQRTGAFDKTIIPGQ